MLKSVRQDKRVWYILAIALLFILAVWSAFQFEIWAQMPIWQVNNVVNVHSAYLVLLTVMLACLIFVFIRMSKQVADLEARLMAREQVGHSEDEFAGQKKARDVETVPLVEHEQVEQSDIKTAEKETDTYPYLPPNPPPKGGKKGSQRGENRLQGTGKVGVYTENG